MATEVKRFNIREGISITDEVVAIISGLAATEVEGVVSLEGNLKNKAIEKAGINKLSKGIKVIPTDEGMDISVAVNIDYGREAQVICKEVQEKVKSTVENMTGMNIGNIDVRVSSVVVENQE